jgi:hypothetical protein
MGCKIWLRSSCCTIEHKLLRNRCAVYFTSPRGNEIVYYDRRHSFPRPHREAVQEHTTPIKTDSIASRDALRVCTKSIMRKSLFLAPVSRETRTAKTSRCYSQSNLIQGAGSGPTWSDPRLELLSTPGHHHPNNPTSNCYRTLSSTLERLSHCYCLLIAPGAELCDIEIRATCVREIIWAVPSLQFLETTNLFVSSLRPPPTRSKITTNLLNILGPSAIKAI